MARPTIKKKGEFSTIGATSATLTSSDYGTVVDGDAIAVFIDTQEDDEAVTAPAGWVEIGQTVMAATSFGTGVGCFVLPAGVAKSGDYTFTYSSNTYQGATYAVVQGTNLKYQAGNAIDGDDNGTDVTIAGFPQGGVDRLGLAGVSSYNATFTVDEGSWTLEQNTNDDFAALFSYDAGTAAVADFDTGLTDSGSSHASVSVVFYELVDIDNLPDLELWLDANDATTITDTSGTVTDWDDKSPNTHTVTVTGDPQTGATTQNSRNVIDLDGTDRFTYGAAADWTFLSNFNGDPNVAEIWLVVKPGTTSNPNDRYALVGTNAGSTANRGFGVWYDDRSSQSRNDALVFDGTRGVASTRWNLNVSADDVAPANEFHIIRIVKDGDEAAAADRSEIYVNNGTAIKNGTATNNASNNAPAYALDVGAGGNDWENLVGSIAEVVIVSRKLDSDLSSWLYDHLEDEWIPSGGLAIAPAGASVSVTAGTLTVAEDQPISPAGASVSVTAGTLTVAEDQAVTPVGATVSVVAGTVTLVADQPITPTGASISVTPGTSTVAAGAATISPTGASVSVTPGSVSVAAGQQVTPVGVTVTVTAGTATVDQGQPIDLAGASVSVTAGTVTLEATVNIDVTGASVSVTAGTVTVTQGITVVPDGATVSVTPGTLSVAAGAVEIAPTGASVSVTAGTVSVVEAQPITAAGVTISVAAGVVTVDQAVELVAATVTVAPGGLSIAADQSISLTGATIAITPGTIVSIIDPSNAFTGRVLAAFSLQATMTAVSLQRIRRQATVEPVNESKGLQP